MPKIRLRQNISQFGRVSPGPLKAIGEGIEQIGELGSAIQRERFQAELRDIDIREAQAQRVAAMEEEHQDRKDAILSTQTKVRNRVRYSEINRGLKNAQSQEELDELREQGAIEVQSIREDSIAQFITPKGQQRFITGSEDQIGTQFLRMNDIFAAKELDFLRQGYVESADALMDGVETQEDFVESFNLLRQISEEAKDAGLKSDFVDVDRERREKLMVQERLLGPLKGNPIAQKQFLEELQGNESTKDILSNTEFNTLLNAASQENTRQITQLNANREYADAHSNARLSALLSSRDSYSEVAPQIMGMVGISEEQRMSAINQLAARNQVGANLAAANTAKQQARSTENEQIAVDNLSNLGDRIELINKEYIEAAKESVSKFSSKEENALTAKFAMNLETTLDAYGRMLNDSREKIGRAEYNRAQNRLLDLRREIGAEGLSEAVLNPNQGAWNSTFKNKDEQSRSVHKMIGDFARDLGNTREETEVAMLMYDTALKEGITTEFLFDTPEEAQVKFAEIKKKVAVTELTNRGVDLESAQRKVEVEFGNGPAPRVVATEDSALQASIRDALDSGLTRESIINIAVESGVTEEQADRAFRSVTGEELVEEELPIEVPIEPVPVEVLTEEVIEEVLEAEEIVEPTKPKPKPKPKKRRSFIRPGRR